ncbi:MAG: universal stress protein, partial [Desulfobacula sp.]|nr:universal stress protein [Desulfobacula sp.]
MNKKIHKILACIDLSEYSLITLEYAMALAKKTGAQIMVLNVINQRDIYRIDMVYGFSPGYYANGVDAEEYVMEVTKERQGRLKQLI